ncbi:MAG: endonuclease Q family protein [Candidatus Cloacimonadales bacterium]
MKLAVDLHSHSGYAGGVGQIELADVSRTMNLKGIQVFGTGDCLLPARAHELKTLLRETEAGLYSLPQDQNKFLLQTEVIFSSRLPGYRNKTVAHHVILFPDFGAIAKMQQLLQKWGMKNTIGRPFIVSNSQKELQDQLWQIAAIDPLLEIFPAHVVTPEGIFGSKNNLSEIKEFYGDFLPQIHAIETGLSADPKMLEKIPELQNLTMISNSDCHSAALNRIGREFTMLKVDDLSYPSIIAALRNNQVDFTAEFNPQEGRFFQTGHRANRAGHTECVKFLKTVPQDLLCPICGKKMNLGVAERCLQLSDDKIKPIQRQFQHLIPLVEVVAAGLQIKNANAKTVRKAFDRIMQNFPSEIALWQDPELEKHLASVAESDIVEKILAVQRGDFSFDPPGFDGNYGVLKI